MVPASLVGYFAAAAQAASALIGLLFVAISLRRESVFGAAALPAARRLAESAFTSLVNAFFVSLVAIIPNTNLGITALIMATLSLVNTVRSRLREGGTAQIAVTGVSVLSYLSQFGFGLGAIIQPSNTGLVSNLAYITVASFGVALARAWRLLRIIAPPSPT